MSGPQHRTPRVPPGHFSAAAFSARASEGLPAEDHTHRHRERAGAHRESLSPGTLLESFNIVRPLGCGGFGTVYLAHDCQLDRDVAIKEYLPLQLAYRAEGLRVEVRSADLAATYAAGLRSFVNEARILARFDHPAIVKVHRFWEANGTAYMVMPWVSGPTLSAMRGLMRRAPTEAWLRGVVDPLLDALAMLHEQGIYHRDIAPDNVLLPGEQTPVLLDFGAARRVIGDRTQSFTSVLKPSFAPIEQYAQARQLRQGPWTDLYALGAVCVYMLTAVPPPPAAARAVHDDMEGLLRPAPAGVSASFLAAIRWALEVRPQDRPQSVPEFRAALDGLIEVPPPRPEPTIVAAGTGASVHLPRETAPPELAAPPASRPLQPTRAPAVPIPSFSATDALAFARAWEPTLRLGAPGSTAGPAVPPLPAARSASRSALLASVAALAAVGAGTAIFFSQGPADPGAATWRALAQHAAAQGEAGLPTIVETGPSDPAAPATPVEETVQQAVQQALGHAGPVVRTLMTAPPAAPATAVALTGRQATPVSPAGDRRAPHAAAKRKASSAGRHGVAPGPREVCSNRNIFRMAACVERRCDTARLRHHPQCVELRRPPEFKWLQHEQT